MKRMILNGAAMAALSAGLAVATGGAARADEASCTALAGSGAFEKTEILSAALVAAAEALPAYCEVTGVIRPVEGSEIGVVYRLPENWNGKALALGGGGWMGNVTLQAAAEGLGRGYATLQTDAGHSADTGTGFDASPWAINADGSLNETKVEDFSHRAIHLMTERGKEVVEAYYGNTPQRAYYQGCSTGGRMGLMEAQRYPGDFDGIIAGAPVYTFQTQTSAILRTNAFAAEGARLLPEHLALINNAVLAACDAEDGAADGILRDPRACHWKPSDLQCVEGQAPETCLTAQQAAAVARVYEGERMSGGAIASYPLEKGSELGWVNFVPASAEGEWGTNSGGLYTFRNVLLGDGFDWSGFNAETVGDVRTTEMAAMYEAKDPDISEFVSNGGRLILWHGVSDPGPSMRGTVEYYEAVNGATPGAADAVRLFLAPGVGHCRGGEGPDTVDWLTALDTWVEQGHAPEELLATKANSDRAWNLCAYPKLPTAKEGEYVCE